MRIHVGNLAFRSNAEDVRKAFAAFGEVASVELMMDRATGRSAGFAFVEMPNEDEAQVALVRVKEINSRVVRVQPATLLEEPLDKPPAGRGDRRPPPRRSQTSGRSGPPRNPRGSHGDRGQRPPRPDRNRPRPPTFEAEGREPSGPAE